MSTIRPRRSELPTDQGSKPKQSRPGLHTSSNASTFLCTNALGVLLKRILHLSLTPPVQPSSFLLPSYSPVLCRSSVLPAEPAAQTLQSFLSISLWVPCFSTLILKAPESQIIRGLGTDNMVQSVVIRPPTSATPRSSSTLISLQIISNRL